MEKIPHGLFRLVGHPVQEQIETRLNALFEDLFDANSEVWASLLDLGKSSTAFFMERATAYPASRYGSGDPIMVGSMSGIYAAVATLLLGGPSTQTSNF